MCTAISVTVKDHYFGRNLDYEHSFGEKVTVTPRNYPFIFRNGKELRSHYAIIGMALLTDNYPLYFDGANEKGLAVAGLNFPGNACYMQKTEGKENVASFEFIPWILAQCDSVSEAEKLIDRINITDEAFDENTVPTPLHWLIADKHRSITVEQTRAGIQVFENFAGALTNNPTFDKQMFNLTNYMSLSTEEPQNTFSEKLTLEPHSRGMGGIGLPGDLSSVSRFVRACFTKLNSEFGDSEPERVNQFFHILYSVYQQKGCVKAQKGFVITHYSSCCNTDRGIYYYTTYDNFSINGIDMHRENLNGKTIVTYDLERISELQIGN